jgi:hypothetical protein
MLSSEELYSIFLGVEKKDPKKLDKWQQEVLDIEGDVTIRAGRQVGKSTIISKRAAKFSLLYANTVRLILAPAQRQSGQLFQKTRLELMRVHDEMLERAGGYKEDPRASRIANLMMKREWELKHGLFTKTPTMTEMHLIGNRKIYALPAGKTGVYLRSYTIDFLDVDEAAYVPEMVWTSIIPMLAVPKKLRGLGWQTLLSTPFGKAGYFYESFHDNNFKQFHISSEKCPRITKSFLDKERSRLSKIEYAQEWLGEFIDEFNQFFPTKLIQDSMTFIEWDNKLDRRKDTFLGVDIARYGTDENAFVLAEMDNQKKVRIIKCMTTERRSLTQTTQEILRMFDSYGLNRIIIDDAGIGAGVFDMLVDRLGRRKVIAMNNAKKSEEEDARTGRVLKEDLYSNALILMEKKQIDIIASLKLQKSLKCMTFEYTDNKNLKIYGKYSHLAEAFVRACWCVKAKSLNLYIV